MVGRLSLAPLNAKLLRDLWRMRSQALAIALVLAAGVGMVVMAMGMVRSLSLTRADYYDLYRFADIFAPAKRMPEAIVDDIARLPGVAAAEGRISAGATLDIAGVAEPVTARVHSLPPGGQPAINALVLRSGRWPDPDRRVEVLVSEQFAKAARISPGDRLDALIYGNRQGLRVVGTAISPEYVYTIGPGQIFPDNRRFGVIWMGEEPLAAALDLTDSVNEVLVRLERGAVEDDVIRKIDSMLDRYGGAGAYPRRDQLSERFLSNELMQLEQMTAILPPIFLGVAAFLIHMVLSRLIDAEREVIGLLMAFGFRRRAIMLFYGKLALALALPGLVLGLGLGTWLGRGLASLYQDFFIFPFLRFRTGPDVFFIASLATLVVVLAGAVQAVRRVGRLTPTEAMRPPLPKGYTGRIARALARLRRLDEPTRIILRGIIRRPMRSAFGSLGVAAALGLYIASAGAQDNSARLIEILFDQSLRADVAVVFAEPRDERALFELSRAPGVWRVEPMRSAGARLGSGIRTRTEALTGAISGGDLYRLVDIEGALIEPPPGGVLLGHGLAHSLGLMPGDRLDIRLTEGRRSQFDLPVTGTFKSPVGNPALVDRATIDRNLFEAPLVSGAYLGVDPARTDELYRYLKRTPNVAGVSLRSAARRSIDDTISETMGIITLFNTGFAALIVFGVVYNNARIGLAERARDLASLRVLGYRRSEVSYVLLGELALIVVAGIPLGIVFGYQLSRFLSASMGGELFILPFGLTAATMAYAVLAVMIAALLSALVVRRRLDRLDLVAVLKTWE